MKIKFEDMKEHLELKDLEIKKLQGVENDLKEQMRKMQVDFVTYQENVLQKLEHRLG